MNWYQHLVRPLFFRLDPEVAHHLALYLLQKGAQFHLIPSFSVENAQPITVMGIKFPNKVGLAAGLDKNAVCIDGLAALGFGFIEVGTLTPKAQPGNPKPRIFRILKAQALINRMGFNNDGLMAAIDRIKKSRADIILGVNVGKNKDTPLENAIDDYLFGFEHAYPVADYITVNLSSPNTPNLRDLQHGEYREKLFARLKQKQQTLFAEYKRYVPLVVKIAPDLADEDLFDLADALLRHNIDGVIATNTTINHAAVQGFPHGKEEGGVSGKPLQQQATDIVKKLYTRLGENIPIIAVGGVMSAQDAKEKFAAGAKLVQIYTGLIYNGPNIVQEINRL